MIDFAVSLFAANIIRNLGCAETNHAVTGEILKIFPQIYDSILDAVSKRKNHGLIEVVYCDPILNKRTQNPEICYEDIIFFRLQERLDRVKIKIISLNLIGHELKLLIRSETTCY